jgi:hypothetical protein
MRVGLGSVKWWVVREMTTTCDCEDVALARMARELLIFHYSHNISDVIGAAMDPKGKALAPTYRVVSMMNRPRKQRVVVVKPLDSGQSSKGARVGATKEEKRAPAAEGTVPPLGVGDFDFSNMELVMKSLLKMASVGGLIC